MHNPLDMLYIDFSSYLVEMTYYLIYERKKTLAAAMVRQNGLRTGFIYRSWIEKPGYPRHMNLKVSRL